MNHRAANVWSSSWQPFQILLKSGVVDLGFFDGFVWIMDSWSNCGGRDDAG
jgi:hypothetical protein